MQTVVVITFPKIRLTHTYLLACDKGLDIVAADRLLKELRDRNDANWMSWNGNVAFHAAF